MAFNYSPKIVTNGLVVCLDAANRNSYTSGSAVWRDISKGGSDAALINGPTFSPVNAGTIVFDGTNDYAVGSLSDPTALNTNGSTVEAWVYHLGIASKVQRYVSTFPPGLEQAVIRFDGAVTNTVLRYYIVTTTGYKFLTSYNEIYVNNWYHVVGTWDGTTQRLYKNNVLSLSSAQTGTLVTGSSTSYMLSLETESLNGYMPIARIYNRALSAAEIQQNFNAQKARFGL